nr:condensation domain-containing protein [Embleya hyalina]
MCTTSCSTPSPPRCSSAIFPCSTTCCSPAGTWPRRRRPRSTRTSPNRQNERLRGDHPDRLVRFRSERLAGAPIPLDPPTDRTRLPVQAFRGAAHRFVMPEETTRSMCALAAAERCTPYMAFIAAYQVLLARHSAQHDICVGTPVANHAPGLESSIGLCLNMVVVRSDLSGPLGYRALPRRARETCRTCSRRANRRSIDWWRPSRPNAT